jgi:16S rRNA processing protein RimM
MIPIAKFGKTHGIKGWIRVYPVDAVELLEAQPWMIKKNYNWLEIKIADRKPYRGFLIIKIDGVDDPETAKLYTNYEIYLPKDALPKLPDNQYYWSQLEGLTVIDLNGKELGKVDHLEETGANDVLVITNNHKRYLIPYIKTVILEVDLTNKFIKVDWDLT